MAKNSSANGTPTGVKLSAYDQTKGKGGSGSSKGSGGAKPKAPGASVGGAGGSGTKGTDGSKGSYGGATKTEGGKTYIQNTNGMWVQADTAAGQRVKDKLAGAGGGRGGSGRGGLDVSVSGAYTTGGTGGAAGNPYGLPDVVVKKYQNDSGITAASGDSVYRTKPVARLKNGAGVSQKYIDEHPDKEYYTLDSSPQVQQAGYVGGVPRYSGGGSYGMIFNGKPVGVMGSNDVLYYPDNVDVPLEAWAANQASQDWNYGGSFGTVDVYKGGMPDAYYEVYRDLASGRGFNGHALGSMDVARQIWDGEGNLDRAAYDRLAAQGVVSPYRDYWGEYGNLSPETGGFARGYAGKRPAADAAGSDAPITSLSGGYSGGGFDLNNNQKGVPNTGVSMMAEYKRALREAQNESARAYERQIEAGLDAIYAQRDPLRQQYDQGAQQAYIAAEKAKRALPQQLAAQGISGGPSESSALAIDTSYGNALNDLTQAYQNSLAGLNQSAAQLEASGDMQLAQNASQYQQMLAQAILQQQQQQEAYRQQMEMAAYQNQMDMQNYEKQLALQRQYKQAAAGTGGEGVTMRNNLSFGGGYDLPENPLVAGSTTGAMGGLLSVSAQLQQLMQEVAAGRISREQAQEQAKLLGVTLAF